MVLRSARDGLAFGPDGSLGTLEVAACCILLGRPGARPPFADDGVREEPGNGRELLEPNGVDGDDRADFLVLGIGREGKGVVGGPIDGLGSVVVAIVED
jgi:hypothetical protein